MNERPIEYVPVLRGTLLWYALKALVTPAQFISARGNGTTSRREAARRQAESFVDDVWGANPSPQFRLPQYNSLHANALTLFAICILPSLGICMLGSDLKSTPLVFLGIVLIACSSLLLAFEPMAIVRGYGMELDFRRWKRAGSPPTWTYRKGSQPRALDLVWGGLVAIAVTAFFAAIVLG